MSARDDKREQAADAAGSEWKVKRVNENSLMIMVPLGMRVGGESDEVSIEELYDAIGQSLRGGKGKVSR